MTVIRRLSRAVPAGPTAPRFRTLATVPDLAGAPGSWVQVMMAGAFTDPRYGDFVIDRAYMDALVKNFSKLDLPVPIDRDHSPYTDGSTAAMGWVRQLQRRDDDTLWAYVLWTSAGTQLVETGEYRYFSPEFIDDYTDKYGKKHGPALLGGGLTNRPFLTGMQEVSLALHSTAGLHSLTDDRVTLGQGRAMFLSAPPQTAKETSTVDREQMIALFGLPTDATDEQILAAAREGQAARAAATTPPAPEAETSEPSPELAAALSRAETANAELRDRVLDDATREGVLAPALRDHMVKTWDREVAATGAATETRALLAAMPRILRTTTTGGGAPALPIPGALAPSVSDDAPRPERVLAKARELMAGRPMLALRDALYEAEGLIEEDRRHVLSAKHEAVSA